MKGQLLLWPGILLGGRPLTPKGCLPICSGDFHSIRCALYPRKSEPARTESDIEWATR